jgi:DNA polymerase delta subunit 4
MAFRSYEYGPCVGVTRLERWERAAALGLNPPLEGSPAKLTSFSEIVDLSWVSPQVREILMSKEGSEDSRLVQCVLYDEV